MQATPFNSGSQDAKKLFRNTDTFILKTLQSIIDKELAAMQTNSKKRHLPLIPPEQHSHTANI